MNKNEKTIVNEPPENAIERLIDSEGIGLFLDEVIEICYQKAEHVRINWQDETLGRAWEKLGEQLDAKVNTKPVTACIDIISGK